MSSHAVYVSNEVTILRETYPLNKSNVTTLAMMFKYDSVKVTYININSKNSNEIWLYIGKASIYLNW